METKRTKLNRALRSRRTRARLSGSAERPRLSVHISNRQVQAQIIDDTSGRTLAASSSLGQKGAANLTEKAVFVGGDIAKKAAKAKVKQVVFDRGHRLYHGRIKAMAEAARAGGLEF